MRLTSSIFASRQRAMDRAEVQVVERQLLDDASSAAAPGSASRA